MYITEWIERLLLVKDMVGECANVFIEVSISNVC